MLIRILFPVAAVALGFLATLFFASRSLAEAEPEKPAAKIVRHNNQFALDLYSKLRDKPGNLFFSPYSISTALAMTYAGARGSTATEMAAALHFGADDPAFHASFGQVVQQLNAAGKQGKYQLSVANALWADDRYKFLDTFTQLVTTNYQAALNRVNFQSESEAARQKINAWVEKQTNDKIKDLLKPGVVNAATRLVLTNAIYFKGTWQYPFLKEQTRDEDFTRADGTRQKVRLMNRKGRVKYLRGDGFQAVELPYAADELSMAVLLPDKADGLADLEKRLTWERLFGWLGGMQHRDVVLSLPKFKQTSEFAPAETLAALGMKDAFSSAADFSGMDGTRDLYLHEVIHKAFVDVNEEGTEAAAATAVVVRALAVRIPDEPTVFRADHPFLFLIRDNRTGSVLFVGRLTDPPKTAADSQPAPKPKL